MRWELRLLGSRNIFQPPRSHSSGTKTVSKSSREIGPAINENWDMFWKFFKPQRGRSSLRSLEAFLVVALLGLSWEAWCSKKAARRIGAHNFSTSNIFAVLDLLAAIGCHLSSLLGHFGCKMVPRSAQHCSKNDSKNAFQNGSTQCSKTSRI